MKHIRIDTSCPASALSPLLRGACMEDVNHELYGGIWSQMIYGEAFAEPAVNDITCDSLTVFGSTWKTDGSALSCTAEGGGPKAVLEDTVFGDGTASALFTLTDDGLAGFLCRVADAKNGGDAFNGYEVAVGKGMVRLARHQFNYVNLCDAPADAEIGKPVALSVSFSGADITVSVNGAVCIRYTDDAPLPAGKLGLRSWNTGMSVSDIVLNGQPVALPPEKKEPQVSSMWMPLGGDADAFALDTDDAFLGNQCQIIRASGETGLYNRGLNRSGMYFAAGKEYRGYLYLKADAPTDVTVSLRNADCSETYASASFTVSGDWTKYPFTLTPSAQEIDGSFAVTLSSGEVKLGYAFLEPGEWGLYKGLHVRRDVGEGLEHMGLSILRFGGCMANASDYRWKSMLGEPENRAPYKGWWYPYSSLGFGILEFIELCEKLGVECVPDFHGYETEEDMRDFARYALGTDEADEWVRRRLQSSHPQPYRLRYIQFGNEERVNDAFADRFIAACRGVWSVAPEITMVMGDFDYKKKITDPYHVEPDATACHLTTLAPHERVLRFADETGQNGKVFFDIHWWSEHGTTPLPFTKAATDLYDTLNAMVPGTGVKLCVYELNANSHDFERGMANAYSTFYAMNHSDVIPCMCSANCLQVDKQNDNDWNQGLLFMNNRSVWYQPAGILLQLLERVWLDGSAAFNEEDVLDPFFNASVMTDGQKYSVCLLNRSDEPQEVRIDLPGCTDKAFRYEMTTLTFPKNAVNTADAPENIVLPDAVPAEAEGCLTLTLAPNTIAAVSL